MGRHASAPLSRLLNQAELPDYIIVEPSGVSDPGQVAHSFFLLRPYVQVDSIIAVVDCEPLLTLKGHNRELIVRQALRQPFGL